MGLPYFVIALIVQFFIRKIKTNSLLLVPLGFLFSQLELLLSFRNKLIKISKKDLTVLLSLGFCTMSAGVVVYYQDSYFTGDILVLNIVFYTQLISMVLCFVLIPLTFKKNDSCEVVEIARCYENDFLGLKGLYEILVGALAGIVITVSVIRLLSSILGFLLGTEEVCLLGECVQSPLFSFIAMINENIAKIFFRGADSSKVAFILTKSILNNEKEAFYLLSKEDFYFQESKFFIVSLISNFINIYALGFCLGTVTLMLRRIDISILKICLKSFLFSIFIKFLTSLLILVRLYL